MSSFSAPLTSPQLTTARTSGYWSRVFACLNTNDIVWQAQAAEDQTTREFITVLWDNETVGSYTDVWEGMMCYLSDTTDLSTANYRGRVRLAPSSTQFFIDLNATVLATGNYITVVRDTDLFARIRSDTLVDSSITYQPLPPQLTGLPTAIVLYDADDNDSEDFTPSQTGIPVDADASAISDWAWDVSGSGAFSIDDPTLEHPTFTFEAGYHYLLRVIYTDDNGTSNYQISHVYCVTRTLTAPVVQAVVAGSITGDIADGWTASVTAYADVSMLLDRTHCVLWHIQHFGDNSSTPFVSNVLMNGRIRSSSIQTEGSAEAGQVQQVGFSLEGITAYMRRLRIPNDIIRATDTPNEWGEIKEPDPYRMAVYAMWVYSTLTNICSFGVESGAFAAWQIGGEPRAIDGGYTIDVLTGILDPIKAAPNYAPDGEVYLARNINYRVTRTGIDLITTFTLGDLISYGIDLDSSNTVSQVTAYGGVFVSAADDFTLYSANSPSIVYLEGETRELTREILEADSTITEAEDELKSRASNHYAFENSKPLLRLSLFDSYAGLLIPTNFQRWSALLPASSNTLGRAWGASDYWWLQSVTLTINTDGSIDTSGEWPAETSFDDAQNNAALLPINLDGMNPVLPVLPNEPAFPTDALENYPTDTPTLDERSPTDPFSGMMAYSPWPPDQAARAAARQNSPGCQTIPILFKQSTNSQSTRVTVLGDDYLMSISGITLYSTAEWQYTFNFLASDGGFVRNPDPLISEGKYGTWVSGTGWTTNDAFASGNYRRGCDIVLTGIASTTFTYFQVKYNYFGIPFVPPGSPASVARIGTNLLWVINDTEMPAGTNLYQAWTGSYTDTSFQIGMSSSVSNVSPVYGGSLAITELTVRGTGTNPFDGSTPLTLYADAFRTFDPSNPDVPASLLGASEGLFIDNTKYTPVPPYSASHAYHNLAYTGTGSVVNARMAFDDYSVKSNDYAYLEVCPK